MTRGLLACFVLLSSVLEAQTPSRTEAPGSPVHASAAKGVWDIDTAHSELAFSIRHMVRQVQGRFTAWSGTLTMAPDGWHDAAVDVTIQTASIETGNKGRDKHLRNADFFDAEKYPVITFRGTKIERDGDRLTIAGQLTMKGVTKPVLLTGKLLSTTAGPKPRMDFQATATINRLDYGVSYNRLVESGTMLGDEVTITITGAVVRQ